MVWAAGTARTGAGREDGDEPGDLGASDPRLVPGSPGHGVGAFREPLWRTGRLTATPLACSIERDPVTRQDALCVPPQQSIDDVRRTIAFDEVDCAQSPSPLSFAYGLFQPETYELAIRIRRTACAISDEAGLRWDPFEHRSNEPPGGKSTANVVVIPEMATHRFRCQQAPRQAVAWAAARAGTWAHEAESSPTAERGRASIGAAKR